VDIEPLIRYASLAVAVTGALCAVPAAMAQSSAPPAARQAELARLLREDCGACHGMTLQGGLGLPLTAAALADKPAEGLVATVLHGRPSTAMPPWSPFMTEEEASWLIERLQAGQVPAVAASRP
jgi:cytochrome c55X